MRSNNETPNCASTDRVAASLQAGANGTTIGISLRPPRGGALIDLLLGLLSLGLGLGIRRRPDDRARRTAQDQSGAGIARSGDDGTEDGA